VGTVKYLLCMQMALQVALLELAVHSVQIQYTMELKYNIAKPSNAFHLRSYQFKHYTYAWIHNVQQATH
jgi:hypothetical protein